MDTSIRFLSAKRGELVLPLSEGPNDAVVLELDKLKKPTVQVAEEKNQAIDNLHEDHKNLCAECWNEWPCNTHYVIHPECKGNECVHRL